MERQKYDFGMIGLGTMGRNFLLNVADNGFSIIGLDADPEKAATLEIEATANNVKGTTSIVEFVELLKPPRRMMLLVPAGQIVDTVIEDLLKHIETQDLIIDGGNSHFSDTDRRLAYLAERNIGFLGVGVSGGAEGARLGPSIMPGGTIEAYRLVQPIFEKVAAKVDGDPCVAYMGNGSSGHYVKMVHNGIEYALMQLLAESYDLLRRVARQSNEQMHETFASWNQGPLKSFLVEITAEILVQRDSLGDGFLIDQILDRAKQKGTGKWTSQDAMDVGIATPSIDAAVTMRQISGLKEQRIEAGKTLNVTASLPTVDVPEFVASLEKALSFAFLTSYAQGMNLLAAASMEMDLQLDLEACARIWRGGCIIRAQLLEDIRKAFSEQSDRKNLLLSGIFRERLLEGQGSCRQILKTAIDAGIPALAFATTLGYFDAFRAARLPLNLVQAQRDFFGSHTYERIDRDGTFHTDWSRNETAVK